MNSKLAVGWVSIVLVLMAVSPVLGGTEGRVAGTVEDPEGNPLVGVQVHVKAIGYDYETSRTTNKKGRFNVLVMDATKDYVIRLEMAGFSTIEEPLDPPLGDTMRHTWTMVPGSGGGSAGTVQGAAPVGPSAEAGTGQAGRKYGQGLEAFQADDLETARTRFQEVIELQPDLPEAHAALAMVLLREEAYGEALAEANKVIELRPDDVTALKVQYEAYAGMDNTEMEEVLLDKLIEVSPDSDLARLVFNSAVAKIQAADLAGGAARFEQVLAMDPEILQTYSALARVYFDMERYDDSIAMAKSYLEQEPNSGDVLGVLYLAYDKQGNEAEAAATFELLKGQDTTHVARVMEQMGVNYFNDGNSQLAQELLERVLEIQPDHARAHYQLALCYVSLGETTKAKELLIRFIELAPDDPDAAVAQEMIATL